MSVGDGSDKQDDWQVRRPDLARGRWAFAFDTGIYLDIDFFFQAEDGIRDGTVTGVQTCALPIFSTSPGGGGAGTPGRSRVSSRHSATTRAQAARRRCRSAGHHRVRSEERRVGKECRCRWVTDQTNKTTGRCAGRTLPAGDGHSRSTPASISTSIFFFKQKTAYEMEL